MRGPRSAGSGGGMRRPEAFHLKRPHPWLGSAAPLLATGLLAASCGGEPEGPPLVVRDSAGIEIVENPVGNDGPASSWQVDSEPAVLLGSEAEGPELFTHIGGLARFPDGGIALLETASLELRLFGPGGEHRRTVGGEGEGPGEFRFPVALGLVGGDTLAVYDLGGGVLNLFDPSGAYLGRRTVSGRASFPEVKWSMTCLNNLPLLPDGSVLRCIDEPGVSQGPSAGPEEGIIRYGWRLGAVRSDGSGVDTLGVHMNRQGWIHFVGSGAFTGGGHPFFPVAHIAAGADPPRVYMAANPAYAVEVWRLDGTLERMIRRPGAARPPTADERERADARFSEDAGEVEAGARGFLPDFEVLPAVHGLAAGPGGELWVKREPATELDAGGPAVFDVFDGKGRFLGVVAMARDVEVRQVGDDWLLATWTDEFDVPYVGVFGLTRQ